MELIGPYLAACLLLVAAGAAKVAHPDDTARAVASVVRLPLRRLRAVVRTGAAAECALGLVALVRPGPVTAGLVAASYLGFAGFVAVARARGGPLATCGCFSTPDTPATRTHVALTLGFAVSAAAVAAGVPAGWITHALGGQPWRGVPVVLLAGLCAWLAYLAMTRLAQVGAARRMLGIARDPAL